MKHPIRRFAALLLALMLTAGAALARTQPLNILLIGVDNPDEYENGRSDAMILVRADSDGGRVRMVSFLRDLYVPIPDHGSNRLNAAYTFGGEELLKQTLYESFGVAVDRTATVHFSLLAQLVDALGGIELEITEKERQELNSLLPKGESEVASAGWQWLNGTQTLCYTRIRKLDSDFQRTQRQQEVLSAMLDRSADIGYWDLLELAVSTLSNIRTDLKLGDMLDLLPIVTRLQELDLESARVPFDGTYQDETINGMMVLKPDLEPIRKQLNDFLYGE